MSDLTRWAGPGRAGLSDLAAWAGHERRLASQNVIAARTEVEMAAAVALWRAADRYADNAMVTRIRDRYIRGS